MNYLLSIITALFLAKIATAQNLYDTTHTKIFAEYLYNTSQYQFAAEEYSRLADSTCTNSLNYALKSVECYEFAYDFKNAANEFQKHILYHRELLPQHRYQYLKLLIKAEDYAQAYSYCDSLQSPFIAKGANIKACLSAINNYAYDYNNQMLLPETQSYCKSEYAKKNMFVAVSLSAVMPGTGRIYCGYFREGITALLRSGFEYAHVIYGFRKYGYNDPYPLFFAAVSACFYVGNIFGTAKTVNKYNKISKQKHDEKIINYMYNTLF